MTINTQTAPFYSEKGWWKSRTVWMGLIGAIFALLGMLGITEVAGLGEEAVVDQIMQIVGLVTSLGAIVFRVKAEAAISDKIIPTSE